jgi:osmotically-inducible protein OsmY
MPTLSPASHEVIDVVQRMLFERQLRGISCECRSGVLRMNGFARSFYQKQLAQEIARRVEGVVQVVNEIEVLP